MATKAQKVELRKWVAALRSGKYKQGRDVLYSPKGYCCLGVAGKAVAKIPAKEMRGRMFLPDGTASRLGLNETLQSRLARMNDKAMMSFKEIASWIEKRFKLE